MHFLLNNLLLQSNNYLKNIKTNQILWLNLRNYCATINQTDQIKSENSRREPQRQAKTDSDAVQRSLHVAVIGVPNAGKSTFINNLINHRVCPTSSKVHTTRNANKAIYTKGNTQLVFLDTPGLVTQREIAKHNLEQAFKSAYRHAVQQADIIAVLHDVSNGWTRNALHSTVLDTLKDFPMLPSVLIMNKIDTLKSKRILLDLIRNLTNNTLSNMRRKGQHRSLKESINSNASDAVKNETANTNVGWSNFSDVFMVSSITGNGLHHVQNYLLNSAKSGAWTFDSNSFTDFTPENLIVESVRARLLEHLPQEIPYNLKSVLEFYTDENDIIYASVQVTCPSVRLERLICGESNGRLRHITERVTSDLIQTFGKTISLTIVTKSKA